MPFNLLKRIFSKKTQITDSSDISPIDTSFIKIREFAKLSPDEKEEVEKYFQEIKPEDTKSILKYSDGLLDRSNYEIEFFMASINDIFKNISSIIKSVNEENYFKALLYKEEIRQGKEEFYKIQREAELRLVALDLYIKKEERRKYDFLGIFGRRNRIKYLNNRSSLLNEFERLKTTIRIIRQHILAVSRTLSEEELLLTDMKEYINSSKYFDANYLNEEICCNYAKLLLQILKVNGIGDSCKLLSLIEDCKFIYAINHGLCLGAVSEKEEKELLSRLEYRNLVPYLAAEQRNIRRYAYIHRNDYIDIIKRINELVKKYSNNSSQKWDDNELKKEISECIELVINYIFTCKNNINNEVIQELRKALFDLYYFYYILNGCNSSLKSFCKMEQRSNDVREALKEWYDWSEKEEYAYYDVKTKELLDGVARVNLPLSRYKSLVNKIPRIIEKLKNDGQLRYLFDIYNNDYTVLIEGEKEWNKVCAIVNNAPFSGRRKYLSSLSCKASIPTYSYLESSKYTTLEDVFYLNKFFSSDESFVDELLNKEFYFMENMDRNLLEIFICAYFRRINYNRRIYIIPKQIVLYGNWLPGFGIEERYHIPDEAIAIYLSTKNHIEKAESLLGSHKFYFRFVSEENGCDYDFHYRSTYPYDNKAVYIPNGTKYSDLSSILDEEVKSSTSSK